MNDQIAYKEEIISSILRIANDQKIVSWDRFIADMKDFIISKYDQKPFTIYKGDWKRRFRAALKHLGYKFGGSVDDCWDEVINSMIKKSPSAKKSTNNANSSSNIITKEEKKTLIEILDRVNDSDKWILSTKKVVEDVFKEVIKASVFEHPIHSFILDLTDPLWKKYFTEEEIIELKLFNTKAFKATPTSLQDYLDSYDELKTAEDIRKYAFTHYLNNEQYDKKWVQQSIISAVDLFLDEGTLNMNGYTEADILFKIWSFVYTLFNDKYITANLGEKISVAVSLAKNNDRSLELEERRVRKAVGAKFDMLFKRGYYEFGSCEVGKDEVTKVDDKYLDDGCFKLPKTLRDMFSTLARKNPNQINSMVTVGYLMMGIHMELVVLDVPVGSLICRVLRTSKYEFPQSISTFTLDFIPLLEAAWIGKELMKETSTIVEKRKRKVVCLEASTTPVSSFRCSFYPKNPSLASITDNSNDSGDTSTSESSSNK